MTYIIFNWKVPVRILFYFSYRSDGTKKDPLKINSMVSIFCKKKKLA